MKSGHSFYIYIYDLEYPFTSALMAPLGASITDSDNFDGKKMTDITAEPNLKSIRSVVQQIGHRFNV